ncbi:hypothetical protein BC834DRAFT_597811 [Gloeopeniophorella convolvens]|nr:hypothetical protein BC834DRAFT_597811 [Gloeopeniophorella convolvens]
MRFHRAVTVCLLGPTSRIYLGRGTSRCQVKYKSKGRVLTEVLTELLQSVSRHATSQWQTQDVARMDRTTFIYRVNKATALWPLVRNSRTRLTLRGPITTRTSSNVDVRHDAAGSPLDPPMPHAVSAPVGYQVGTTSGYPVLTAYNTIPDASLGYGTHGYPPGGSSAPHFFDPACCGPPQMPVANGWRWSGPGAEVSRRAALLPRR